MMNRGLRALAKLSFLVFLGGCSASHAQTQPPPARTYAVAPAHLGDGPTVHRWSRADRRRLSSALSADFTSPSVDGVVGVSVVADDGSIVYDLRGDHPMTPASTMKLIVGSTALFRLGEGDHLVTSFETLAPPRNDGVVDDLWLVGGGDPVLTTDDLARGVGALRRSGVRLVRNLVLDATRFAGPEQNPAWSPEDDQYDYAAGTSALSLDWDVLKTVVDGAEVYRPVTNIPSYVAGVVSKLMKRAGIAVDHIRFANAPLGGTTIWAHPSPSIDALVHQMFLESDNHIAEQLLRSLGAQSGIGTDQAGARIERGLLEELGVPQNGLRILDGSGLAPGDKTTPRTLAVLLQRVASRPEGPYLIRDLARAGVEGTVRYHHLTDAAGRVRAKSGHIDGVDALAGYVQTRHHGRVAFAFIVNQAGVDDDAVERIYDLALDQLSEF